MARYPRLHKSGKRKLSPSMHCTNALPFALDCGCNVTRCFNFLLPLLPHNDRLKPGIVRQIKLSSLHLFSQGMLPQQLEIKPTQTKGLEIC